MCWPLSQGVYSKMLSIFSSRRRISSSAHWACYTGLAAAVLPPSTPYILARSKGGWGMSAVRGLWEAGAVWTLRLSGRCLSWKVQLRPHEINCNCRLSGLSTFYTSFLCSADKKDPLRTCNICSSGRMKGGSLPFQECALQKCSFVPVNLLRSRLKTRKTFIQTSGMLLSPFNFARRKPF